MSKMSKMSNKPTTVVCPECAAYHGWDVGVLNPETGRYTCLRGHEFYDE